MVGGLGWLVGWGGWLVGWLVSWLVGWLVCAEFDDFREFVSCGGGWFLMVVGCGWFVMVVSCGWFVGGLIFSKNWFFVMDSMPWKQKALWTFDQRFMNT